jgi:hypothetical protein
MREASSFEIREEFENLRVLPEYGAEGNCLGIRLFAIYFI